MNLQEQHDLLVLVQGKLISHFQLDKDQEGEFYLTLDEKEETWILFGDRVVFSFEDDKPESILTVSFDMSLEPVIVANIMFSLLRNNIDLEIMESYYQSKMDGNLYWGEGAESKYKEEILLEYEDDE